MLRSFLSWVGRRRPNTGEPQQREKSKGREQSTMGSLTFVCKHEGEVWNASAKEAEVSTSAASESEVKSECFNLAKEHLGSGFKVWSATIQPNKSVVFQGYFPVGGVAVAGGEHPRSFAFCSQLMLCITIALLCSLLHCRRRGSRSWRWRAVRRWRRREAGGRRRGRGGGALSPSTRALYSICVHKHCSSRRWSSTSSTDVVAHKLGILPHSVRIALVR